MVIFRLCSGYPLCIFCQRLDKIRHKGTIKNRDMQIKNEIKSFFLHFSVQRLAFVNKKLYLCSRKRLCDNNRGTTGHHRETTAGISGRHREATMGTTGHHRETTMGMTGRHREAIVGTTGHHREATMGMTRG